MIYNVDFIQILTEEELAANNETTEQHPTNSHTNVQMHTPDINPVENKPLDVGALPGPQGNAIDISPDGLSELTFGQLLVLFSKIDQAKKQGKIFSLTLFRIGF